MYLNEVMESVVDGNRYLDRQETVRIFSTLAKRLIQDYVDRTGEHGHSVQDCLVLDTSSDD